MRDTGENKTQSRIYDQIKAAMYDPIVFKNNVTIYASHHRFPAVIREQRPHGRRHFHRGMGQLIGVFFSESDLLTLANKYITPLTQGVTPEATWLKGKNLKKSGVTVSFPHIAYYLLVHMEGGEQYAQRLFSHNLLISFETRAMAPKECAS